MRIVVVATAASEGGALTILKSLHSYASRNLTEHEWLFLVSGSHLTDSLGAGSVLELNWTKRSWLHRLYFDVVRGKEIIDGWNPDVVLSLQDTLPWRLEYPTIVYAHQPVPFQTEMNFSFLRPTEMRLAAYQHIIGRLGKRTISRASATIVQTEWMRRAVIEQTGALPRSVVVMPPELPELTLDKRSGSFDARLFICPTSAQPYKNNGLVIEACRLVGQDGYADFGVEMTTDGNLDSPYVHAVGSVPRAALLRRLSEGSLIFPSRIESYGLPLIEASAFGVPVLAADLPYAHEVLQGYPNAFFFTPTDARQLASLMERVMDGQIRRIRPDSLSEPQGWKGLDELIQSVGENATTSY